MDDYSVCEAFQWVAVVVEIEFHEATFKSDKNYFYNYLLALLGHIAGYDKPVVLPQ